MKLRRFLWTAENDFEGTRTTIPRVRDATGQGCDGGTFVCVHAGRGQDTCISEQYGGHTRASRVALRAWEECVEGDKAREPDGARESVLFIGTQFSILYTFMYSPA